MNTNYVLPHPLSRLGQQETIDQILSSKSKVFIVDAPTGSGKSAWAAEASRYHKTMVLTETKSLQAENYEATYGFDVSYGRGNYTCAETGDTAELCPEKHCDPKCEYKIARARAIKSQRLSVNYAKYLLDFRLAISHDTEILFLDEAHRLPHITMDNSGVELKWDHRFINMEPRFIPAGSTNVSRTHGQKALRDIMKAVIRNEVQWIGGQPKDRERLRWERMLTKIKQVMAYVQYTDNPNSWFYDGEDGESLTIKPLTPMYNYGKMFDSSPKTVLMSATIGNPEVLARRLGIANYEYIKIDGEFGPKMRPVWDMKGPKLKYDKNFRHQGGLSDVILREQTDAINKTISMLPNHWTGILHTKSKAHAYEIKKRIARVVTMPKFVQGTDNQLIWWNANRMPGTVLAHHAFWEGVSLDDDNISIVCKAPFPNLGDAYGRAVMEYDRDGYRQSTACDVEQACGRVRRGHREHYGPDAEKFVGIADGNWSRVKSCYSDSFRGSVRDYEL